MACCEEPAAGGGTKKRVLVGRVLSCWAAACASVAKEEISSRVIARMDVPRVRLGGLESTVNLLVKRHGGRTSHRPRYARAFAVRARSRRGDGVRTALLPLKDHVGWNRYVVPRMNCESPT